MKNKIAKPNKILENSNSFFNAAINLWEIDNMRMYYPQFVNLVFSCELFIKAVLQATRNYFPFTHNLKKLYYALNGKIQNEISDELRKVTNYEIESRCVGIEQHYGMRQVRRYLTLDETKDQIKFILRHTANAYEE